MLYFSSTTHQISSHLSRNDIARAVMLSRQVCTKQHSDPQKLRQNRPGVAHTQEAWRQQKNHRNTTESRRTNPIALDRSPHHLSPPTPPHSPTHSAAHPQTDTFHPPPQSPHARPSIIKSHMNNTGHIITIHSINRKLSISTSTSTSRTGWPPCLPIYSQRRTHLVLAGSPCLLQAGR